MNEGFDSEKSGAEAAASGSNEGKILTSTLWAQKGTVYVCVDGEQTALTGYAYNRFCPLYSGDSRAVTGCSNTADAQILYYWLEKGYDLRLAVTTDNYFSLGSEENVFHVSDTAHADEGTLSELNAILGSSDRIGNGDFIAALIFYCGVNNHSLYGSATLSWWDYWVSADGLGAEAFVASGFDSYYFIARKADGPVPGLFFIGDKGLAETGLSILRENLDYGEPIRVGVPGHAVYMDGYRLDSETGEYEYHLNYGYGRKYAGTKWYTVAELESITIGYFCIDTSPDVTVRVSNARNDYRGGSFLRGLERINHIVNDKSTFFDFDSELAGETILLAETAVITSAVDVAFRNIGVTLATTADGLFASARGMSFDISGGGLIADSDRVAYAIRETGNSAVNVTVKNGFIYTGNATGGISAVRDKLFTVGGYSLDGLYGGIRTSVAGYAVKAGNAADTVTLESAALLGGLDLGGGENVLTLGAGSLFYGTFAGAAETLTVNLDLGAGGATIALADSASLEAFRLATGGVLNLNFGAAKPVNRNYELLCGTGAGLSRMFAVNLTVQGETVTLDGDHARYGCFTLKDEGAKLVLSCMPDPTPGDLDGDGRADIVLTLARAGHSADGATGAWLINDDQTAAWGDLSQRDPGWEIFGTGYTAAGKKNADVYVRNSDNTIGAWTTDAEGRVSGWETVGSFDAATKLIGLGDFNGDGQTDLLLRNDNGAVGCYLTSGDATGWNYFQSLGDEWSICAVGDLNGDGRDDLILKHDAGFAGSWLTQADCTMAWADLDTVQDTFEIVGTGDFNADGTSDVLLRSGTYYGAWIVRNGSVSAWMGFGDLGGVTVEQIGDFDADGRDDLRIRTAAGDIGTMLVKGEDSLVWNYYGSVGSEWSSRLAAV